MTDEKALLPGGDHVVGREDDLGDQTVTSLVTSGDCEERFRELADSITDVFFAMDRDLKYTYWNRASEQLLGIPAQVALGKTLTEVFPDTPEIRKAQATYREVMETQKPKTFITEYRAGDHGAWFEISVYPSVSGISVFAKDISDRKRTEEALRASEAKLRTFVANQPGVAYVLDKEGVFLLSEGQGLKHLGLTPGQVVGLSAFDVYQDYPDIGDGIRKALAGEDHSSIITVGHLVYESWMGPLTDESGNVTGVIGVASDITARRQSEAEIAAQQHQLESIAANLPGVVYQFHALNSGEYEFTYISDRFFEVFGLESDVAPQFDELLRRTHPDDRDALLASIQEAVTTGRPWRFEGRLLKSSGEVLWLSGASNPTRMPDRIVFDGLLLDITDRMRAEEALKESEARNRALLDAIPDTMFVFDRDGRFVDYNTSDRGSLLQPPEAFLGQHVSAVLPPELADMTTDRMHKVLQTREPQIYEYQLDVHGEHRHFEARLVLCGEDSALSIVRDITARKQAEAEQAKLQEQLLQAQKMETVGRLAGGVAHDFNNMLGVILGHTEMAMGRLDPDDPRHADLDEIRKAAHRSADLTRHLLAFARKQTVAPRVLDLNDTIAGMLRLLRRLIGEDIELIWRPGYKLWPVRIDPVQVDQILANLCVNARDAIAGPGTITIETGNAILDADSCAHHAGLAPGAHVLLAVSDDGCGMDAEMLSHIFEPFYTNKETGKGTGLGLATVYGTVRQNNGFIHVLSEPGQGATFKIYLPSQDALAPEDQPDEPKPQLETGVSETILLVEDEPSILRVAAMMLEELGYVVLKAAAPSEAIRLAGEHPGPIDLVITDVVMPEMNGRDLAANLLSKQPTMRCMFMSGYTANVIAQHGILEPDVHFLQKPFSMKQLAAGIRDALK